MKIPEENFALYKIYVCGINGPLPPSTKKRTEEPTSASDWALTIKSLEDTHKRGIDVNVDKKVLKASGGVHTVKVRSGIVDVGRTLSIFVHRTLYGLRRGIHERRRLRRDCFRRDDMFQRLQRHQRVIMLLLGVEMNVDGSLTGKT